MKKETEEATFNRVNSDMLNLYRGEDLEYYVDELCKTYHQERLKVLMPTDEEIENKVDGLEDTAISQADFMRGVNWLKSKLLNNK